MTKGKNCVKCYNSTGCNNSTRCDNSTYCIFCDKLTLEKFMIFNKSVKTKEAYLKIRESLGYLKHPKKLTEEDVASLKKKLGNLFDQKVLDAVIENSILPDELRGNIDDE